MTLVAVIEGVAPLTANARGRGGWAQHRAAEKQLLELALADAFVRRGGRDFVLPAPFAAVMVVTPPDRIRRDLDGLAPTLKRMLDAAVYARWIPDDNTDVIGAIAIRTTPPGPRWRLELHLEPLRTTEAATP
jgi:hypothetical protein